MRVRDKADVTLHAYRAEPCWHRRFRFFFLSTCSSLQHRPSPSRPALCTLKASVSATPPAMPGWSSHPPMLYPGLRRVLALPLNTSSLLGALMLIFSRRKVDSHHRAATDDESPGLLPLLRHLPLQRMHQYRCTTCSAGRGGARAAGWDPVENASSCPGSPAQPSCTPS